MFKVRLDTVDFPASGKTSAHVIEQEIKARTKFWIPSRSRLLLSDHKNYALNVDNTLESYYSQRPSPKIMAYARRLLAHSIHKAKRSDARQLSPWLFEASTLFFHTSHLGHFAKEAGILNLSGRKIQELLWLTPEFYAQFARIWNMISRP